MSYSDRNNYGRGRNVKWRGAIPGNETPPEHLEFTSEEYEQLPDRVKIALGKVIEKLPVPSKKKYMQLEHQKMVFEKEESLIQAGLDGDTLRRWTNEYAHATQAGRAWSVVLDTLNQVQGLVREYGAGLVNLGLTKCLSTGKPQTCTAPYLRAVLKNLQPPAAPPQPEAAAAEQGDPWERMMKILQERINARSFATWIRPLRPGRITDQELHVICPDDVYVSWLHEHYTQVFCHAYAQVFGHELTHLMWETT